MNNKRIHKAIKNFKRSNLENLGIHCFFSEKNFYEVKILIIGPKESPYENGFYLFTLSFPEEYPWKPPVVKYCTQGQNIRFNPNLYKNGKVCVSILNTWDGPGWTSCCSLNTILLSLQSLLCENPINNEPGWEHIDKTHKKSVMYNQILTYSNIRIAVIDNVINTHSDFECFKHLMTDYVIKNKNVYKKMILDIEKHNNNKLLSYIYNMTITVDYDYCIENIKKIIPDIIEKKKQKKKRQAPNYKSSDYDIGYKMISENNGELYIVSLTKTGKKRWKLNKII